MLAEECETGVTIKDTPEALPLPATATQPQTRLSVEYGNLPAAAPGDVVPLVIHIEGEVSEGALLQVEGPDGWPVVPAVTHLNSFPRAVPLTLHAPYETNGAVEEYVWWAPFNNVHQVELRQAGA